MTNWRPCEPTKTRPSGPVRVEKKPMTKEPVALTIRVPQGNVSPKCPAESPEIRKRAPPPSALPSITQRYSIYRSPRQSNRVFQRAAVQAWRYDGGKYVKA